MQLGVKLMDVLYFAPCSLHQKPGSPGTKNLNANLRPEAAVRLNRISPPDTVSSISAYEPFSLYGSTAALNRFARKLRSLRRSVRIGLLK